MSVWTQTNRTAQNYQSSLSPLDSAAEYIRERWDRIILQYLVAIAPFSAAVFFLINIVASRHRSALPAGCFFLALATLWRWGMLAVVQRRVQEDMRGEPPIPIRRRVLQIIILRLTASFAILWGSVLLAPAFFGIFISGFAAPLMLEDEGRIVPLTVKGLKWINESSRRLTKLLMALTFFSLLTFLGVLILQYFLMGPVFSSIMGLDVVDLSLTLGSRAWSMSIYFFIFVIFDFYWAVVSVMLFYDLRARRLGSDLRMRLNYLEESQL